jgi:hypothetical protein
LTWRLIGDWRFTMHAYPFFLIASCVAIAALCHAAHIRHWRARIAALTRPRVAQWAAALLIIAAIAYGATTHLPVLVAKEQLAAGTPVSITTGPRDGAFFADGWGPYRTDGNVTSRTSTSDFPEIELPLVPERAYQGTIRVDPSPPPEPGTGPLPVLRIFVNGQAVHAAPMGWDPQRVGAYTFDIPSRLVESRRTRLTLSATYPDGSPGRLRVWYVRVTPLTR